MNIRGKFVGRALLSLVLVTTAWAFGRELSRRAPDPELWRWHPTGAAVDEASLAPDNPWRPWQLGVDRSRAEAVVEYRDVPQAPVLRIAIRRTDVAAPDAVRLARRLKPVTPDQPLRLRLVARGDRPRTIRLRLESLADGEQPLGWEAEWSVGTDWTTGQWELRPDRASDHALVVLALGGDGAAVDLQTAEVEWAAELPAASPDP